MAEFQGLIPEESILDRLRFENPWWQTGSVDELIKKMNRRPYFRLFYPLIEDKSLRRAIVLMGPRRVGKTVMMYHAIQELMDEATPPSSIFFAAIDNPVYADLSLEKMMQLAMKATGRVNAQGAYVFFDEIQYLNDWERHLKVLVDCYPETKFIVSGSSGAALRVKSNESGAGRFHDFLLPPLTFHEFLHLQNLRGLVRESDDENATPPVARYHAIDIKTLNDQFFRYLNYGGYPEVLFSETVRGDMSRFIKKDIVDKVLLRDLPGLYGITDIQELNRFFTYLAYHTGKEFSPQTMVNCATNFGTNLKRGTPLLVVQHC
jgi:uncharacterized protein